MVVVCVRLPDLPVIVMVRVPVAAELLAVNVTVLDDVAGFGLNAAVVPLPMPDAERVTLPVKPPDGVIVIVLLPCEPRVMVTLVGEAESEKLPDEDEFTVSEIVVVWLMLPDTPVMVTVAVPVVAELLAVNVTTLVEVVGFVPNAAVTPVGKPEAESVTLPVNPSISFTVIVLVPPAPPCVMLTLPGEADKVNVGEDEVGASAFSRFAPFMLPQPLSRS